MDRLRVGTLGAARITPAALIKPAREVPEVVVTAVAARDPARARQFADRHGIPVVHDSYAALIADPEIDAIYNPLPNSLHAPWTLRAIAAGKHVLCEKPFTSNEAEAIEVADAARSSGLVVMEAFHYLDHPLARRMLDVVAGELGRLRHVEATLCFPLPRFSDIRYQLASLLPVNAPPGHRTTPRRAGARAAAPSAACSTRLGLRTASPRSAWSACIRARTGHPPLIPSHRAETPRLCPPWQATIIDP